VNLSARTHGQGIGVQAACRWYREGTRPVPVQKAGRLVLVSPEAAGAARKTGDAGLYARVSWHGQKSGLDGQPAPLFAWVVKAGLPTVRVQAEAGSGMNGSRAKVHRLLPGPAVTVVVAGHRDRPGRINTELAEVTRSAPDRRLVVPGDSGVTGDVVRDMGAALTWFCARRCGRRPARNRALPTLGCARQDTGLRAVKGQACGGAG